MGLQSHRLCHCHDRQSSCPSFATIIPFVFLLISSFSTQPCTAVEEGRSVEATLMKESLTKLINRVLSTRTRLIGPGSSPPTCRFKCGRCLPCKPVKFPIHPGLSYPLEYYPEAWRCMCGNKHFMP